MRTLVFLLSMAAPVFAFADEDSGILSGAGIERVFSGATVEATVLGGRVYVEHFFPDGAMTISGPDGVRAGTWSVEDDRICVDFGDPSAAGCWRVARRGDVVSWLRDDGSIDCEAVLTSDGETADRSAPGPAARRVGDQAPG